MKTGPGNFTETHIINNENKRQYWNLNNEEESIYMNLQFKHGLRL